MRRYAFAAFILTALCVPPAYAVDGTLAPVTVSVEADAPTAPAFADGAAAEFTDPSIRETIALALDALTDPATPWEVGLGAGVLVLVLAARRWGGELWDPLDSDLSDGILTVSIAAGGAIVHALAAGAEVASWELWRTALIVAGVAIAGHMGWELRRAQKGEPTRELPGDPPAEARA